MKKKVILYSVVAIIVLLIFFAGYVAAWIETENFARENFGKAQEMLKEGKYLQALNGYQEFDPKAQKYVTYVGFSQISVMFKDSPIFGVPKIVDQSKQEVMKLIATMPTNDLETYFQSTVRNKNPYILYVVAELIHRYSKLGLSSQVGMYEHIFSLLGGKPDQIERYYNTLHTEAEK